MMSDSATIYIVTMLATASRRRATSSAHARPMRRYYCRRVPLIWMIALLCRARPRALLPPRPLQALAATRASMPEGGVVGGEAHADGCDLRFEVIARLMIRHLAGLGAVRRT